MHMLYLIVVCLLCVSISPAQAADELLQAERTATIDFLLENAITNKLIAGGVIIVGNHSGILYTTARGRLNESPLSPPITEHTIFDVASLTKVFATTPAIMKLLETGQIRLTDPLTRWFPEFEGSGREDITILNLLTHTSGLGDGALNSADSFASMIRNASHQKQWQPPGNRFHYADINFVLLGELVKRASGSPLDMFVHEEFYQPLGFRETMFVPPRSRFSIIAPTLKDNHELTSGPLQDQNARRLGGITGHAGLFSTAADLAKFARLILSGGKLDGTRILSERVIEQMTAPYFYSNGRVMRGLGWDIESPYSAPKGTFFSRMSFGHTGYSGSSIWIDPQRDLFVVMLTTRLDYRDIRLINRLRSDVSTMAVAIFWPFQNKILHNLSEPNL